MVKILLSDHAINPSFLISETAMKKKKPGIPKGSTFGSSAIMLS
jgi:hypothetical protein